MVGSDYRKRKFVSLRHFLLSCKSFIFFCVPCCCFANDAEKDLIPEYLNLAYAPWYTGSLFSFSGKTIPEKTGQYQPYVIVNANYGTYRDHFSIEKTHHEVEINPIFIVYYGFTKWMDMQAEFQTFTKIKKSKHSTHLGDQRFLLGFQILRQTRNLPYVRFIVQETFPTGKYKKLKKNNLNTDSTGDGAFATTFGVFIQKMHDWFYYHPIRLHYNFTYTIPSNVRVKGLNSYGGSETTDGIVKPGTTFYFLFAPEISITQNWAFNFDVIYFHVFPGSFSGQKGLDEDGFEATINTKAIDLVQFAPAIEYNFSANLGILWGLSLSITGKNTDSFLGGLISMIGSF